jgi:Ca2+-binding EF-hand superfamily protein
MGNENDKRLNKSNVRPNNPITQSQKLPNQNMSINQQQNTNAYGQNNAQNPNQNRKNIGVPPVTLNNNNNNNNNQMMSRSFTKKNNTITKKMLRDAFRTYSIDGSYLNKPRFNDAIESIFRFKIPEMHYTHLCNKIYELLDSSKDGKIQEDEFLEGMGRVLKERNFRFLLSMMAMMTGDITRDYIEVREIKEFFYLSYVEGFRHLGWQLKRNKDELIKNNIPLATVQQLGKWAEKSKRQIEDTIERELKSFDPNITTVVSLEQFTRWLSRDYTIYLKYANKNIMIATSLIKLDEIYYDESVDVSSTGGAFPSI